MKDFLHHLFIPRESNNHRARLLHHQSILITIVFLFSLGFLLPSYKNQLQGVLGVATNIRTDELLKLTNEERTKQGLDALKINEELSSAAQQKANDMFAKNYWAHNSPDGKTPWFFVKGSGYQYVYAGENLARGFSVSKEVVSAWMASPTHRANVLSANYQDIGFAIVDGKLLGEETTLVVEMFGNKTTALSKKNETPIVLEEVTEKNPVTRQTFAASVEKKPLLNSFGISWSMSLIILSLFVFVLMLDMIVIKRKKVIRFVGHNADHILFLTGMIILIVLFSKGLII